MLDLKTVEKIKIEFTESELIALKVLMIRKPHTVPISRKGLVNSLPESLQELLKDSLDILNIDLSEFSLEELKPLCAHYQSEVHLYNEFFISLQEQNPELFDELIKWFFNDAAKEGYEIDPYFKAKAVRFAAEAGLLPFFAKKYFTETFCKSGENIWVIYYVGVDNLADDPELRQHLFNNPCVKAQRFIAKHIKKKSLPFLTGYTDKAAGKIIESRMNGVESMGDLDHIEYLYLK